MNNLILLGILLLALCGCGEEKKSLKQNNTSKSQITKNLQSKTLGPFRIGEKIELTSVTGSKLTIVKTQTGFKLDKSDKIILFDIFGTYCQPCRDEAQNLMNFQLKHSNDLVIIGLIYYEDVQDSHVLENFIKRYNAYYFIVNSKQNSRLVEAIAIDTGFEFDKIVLPFKVISKNGEYQDLSDQKNNKKKNKYYLGSINIQIIEQDINKILNQ